MDSFTSIFLGIIQGLTEFLPISSSGHLVLFQNILGFKEPELLLDVSLHLGTLIAVCIFFRSDLKGMIEETWRFSTNLLNGRKGPYVDKGVNLWLTLWVLVGTVPTVLIGLVFRAPLEGLFGDVKKTGFMLVCTGVILALTRLLPKDYTVRKEVGLLTALAVGAAQGIAIIPGISRSGATIVCGMAFGMGRELSARFSFLLSIPAIAGAMLLELASGRFGGVNFIPLILGLLSSAIVGLIALKILMTIVRKGNLSFFAPYCWALGIFIIASYW